MSFYNNYIAKAIEENWETFPYKLDYLLYKIFTNYPNTSDIALKKYDTGYKVSFIRNAGSLNEVDFKSFNISQEELFNALKINNSNISESLYTTEIFSLEAKFRCQKFAETISLRFLNTGNNADCKEFNEKINQYSFYSKLNQKLPNKPIKENKIKL